MRDRNTYRVESYYEGGDQGWIVVSDNEISGEEWHKAALLRGFFLCRADADSVCKNMNKYGFGSK